MSLARWYASKECMKVVVYNLGCKVNQYESDAILHRLYELGYEVSSNLEEADAYILNTCAVTNEAEKKSRQAVAKCRKLNANAKILVCGCASQNDSKQFVDKEGVTYISGTAGKGNIPDMLEQAGIYVSDISNVYEDNLTPEITRTRAYVKVQDGCNNFCSYCLIPYVRGRSRSRNLDSVVAECESLAQYAKEIVITGIDISSYGKDSEESLASLLRAISHIKVRVRLGSLEVRVVNDELLQAMQGMYAFCPHFHLSLQSGDDATLKAMNRHYTTAEYAEKVALIRRYYPDANITTDLICGFPTETEEQFENTLRFLSEIKFGNVHCFAYSKRNGTKAEKLGMLDKQIVAKRMARLESLVRDMKKAYDSKFIGREVEVLVEDNGGYTREYVRVNGINAEADSLVKCVPSLVDGEGLVIE